MSFMQPDVQQFTAYQVETSCGTESVPTAVCGAIKDATDLEQYLEGHVDADTEFEKVTGWWSRLSAPGYMDCTEWSGPYATRAEAKAALVDMYGDDEEGE